MLKRRIAPKVRPYFLASALTLDEGSKGRFVRPSGRETQEAGRDLGHPCRTAGKGFLDARCRNGRGGASVKTARPSAHDAGRVRRYARSRLAGEVLTRATMSRAYRADRAEELERAARPNAYCWFSFALVTVACACLILAAAIGAAVAAGNRCRAGALGRRCGVLCISSAFKGVRTSASHAERYLEELEPAEGTQCSAWQRLRLN